jgi:dihydrofolate reductase
MKKIFVFNYISLDGCYAGPGGEIDWFKLIKKDDEFDKYTHEQATGNSSIIMGRTTYEMMKSFWPTPDGIKSDPAMAKTMNESPKIVYSKKLDAVQESPVWKNIKFYHEINPFDVTIMKEQGDRDFVILGSGSIVRQFMDFGLIDEYSLVIVPVILGAGKRLFQDVNKTELKLVETRSFANGIVFTRYAPVVKI